MVISFSDHFEMLIDGLRFWVSLGCSTEEKSNPQPVDIHIKFHFFNEPAGCCSDQISDVICYKTIVDSISISLQNRSFNLIESLAKHIFDTIAEQLKTQDAAIEVTIAKPHHPVMNVHRPTSFKYARRLSKKLS